MIQCLQVIYFLFVFSIDLVLPLLICVIFPTKTNFSENSKHHKPQGYLIPIERTLYGAIKGASLNPIIIEHYRLTIECICHKCHQLYKDWTKQTGPALGLGRSGLGSSSKKSFIATQAFLDSQVAEEFGFCNRVPVQGINFFFSLLQNHPKGNCG